MKLSDVLICATAVASAVILVTCETSIYKSRNIKRHYEPRRVVTIHYGFRSYTVEIDYGRVRVIRSTAVLSEHRNIESMITATIQCELDAGMSINNAVRNSCRKHGCWL